MKIEILKSGAVITLVDNVMDPEREVTRFGGDAWALYVETDAVRLERLRGEMIEAIKAEGLRRIGLVIPALAIIEMLDLIVEAVSAGMMNAPQPGSDMETVKDIYLHARSRVAYAKTATEDQLNQYDPATDHGWPQ